MILIIDNYDSFVFNLARYVRELGDRVHVVRNDALNLEDALALAPSGIIISPGPCGPDEAGISTPLAGEAIAQGIPLLGVCLGHQCIVAACGGGVGRAARPVHGQASAITHNGSGVFTGLTSPLEVGRYHSLVATGTLPGDLDITARLADDPGTVMGVAHRTSPVFGVQFHPESVLTEHGHALIGNFLRMTHTQLARSAE